MDLSELLGDDLPKADPRIPKRMNEIELADLLGIAASQIRLKAREGTIVRVWAYQRGICEAIDDPEIERVTVIKSARIGYPNDLETPFGRLPQTGRLRDRFWRRWSRGSCARFHPVPLRATDRFGEGGIGVRSTIYPEIDDQVAQSPLKSLARQRTANDFRALSILSIGEFSGLQEVTEQGEIKAMTTGESKEGYSLKTFGGTFALSRKALINDDLGAFGRWGEMMGRTAAETEAAQLMGLLTVNAGGGVKLNDGKNLFHADHGNLAVAGTTLASNTLAAARLAMRTQKGLDGKTPINVVPKYLLVGPALETLAEAYLSEINATSVDDVNPFASKLTLLVEPRIEGTGWYIFADPASAPVLEYAHLSGAPGPQLSSRDGWEILGREFRVVLDFGCGAVDHRGAYRNAGG